MAEVFVSYKHSKYEAEARALYRILEDRHGIPCFFDQRDSRWDLSDDQLRTYLSPLIRTSKAVVFFETFAEQVAYLVMRVGGDPVVESTAARPSWQEWELSEAWESPERCVVLYHSANPRALQYGLRGGRDVYSDLSDAATKVAEYVAEMVN
ncbi:hypothetical protein [Streptomyces sp. NPDC058964]|uniref:hypothetical protein n=1 Tax=Streptomyces sp. NPDC058964 TaxID=3346681 RepID=UPI003673E356